MPILLFKFQGITAQATVYCGLMLALFSSAVPLLPDAHPRSDMLQHLQTYAADLALRLANEEKHYKSLVVPPSLPTLDVHWRRFARGITTVNVRRHRSAALIQSVWRTRHPSPIPPNLGPFFSLSLRHLQVAELHGLQALADDLLDNVVATAIGLDREGPDDV
jgi:hypothetical protein